MKKTYQMPTTKWVEAQAEEIMGESMFSTNTDGDLIQDLSTPQTTTEASGNLTRQGLWDDFEE